MITAQRQLRCCQVALGLGLALVLLGVVVVVGWAFHLQALKTLFPGLVTMKVNTAIGLWCSGAALTLLACHLTGLVVHRIIEGLAAVVLLIGMLTLGEYFFGWNLEIDNLLFQDVATSVGTSSPGRMAPATAICLMLSGVSLVLAAERIAPRIRIPTLSALGGSLFLIGIIGCIGQLTNAFGFAIWNYSGMAIHTALGFFMVGGSLLALVIGENEFAWALDTTTTLGFAVAVIVMMTVTGISWNYTFRMQAAGAHVSHANEVLKAIENIRAGIANLESGQRGYIITGNEHLLDERDDVFSAVQQNIATLRQLTSDDAGLQNRLGGLEKKIATRIEFSDQTIALRRTQGFAAAQQLLSSGTGISLIKEINALLISMRETEYALLLSRQKAVDDMSMTTFLFLPASVYLSLTILSLALFFLNNGVAEQKRDFAERKKAEVALQKSEREFRTMANAIPQLAWMARADGFIFWYNQRWYDYTGTTPEQMEGWGWQRVHDIEILPAVMEKWQLAIATGESFEMEFPLRAADGHFGWFLTRIVPLKDENGRVLQWFGTNTDLSQKRADAEEIQRLNASLEQRVAERTTELEFANKELEAFSYSVSHDLRAPLRAVDGFSHSVMEDYGSLLPAEGRKDLQTIRSAAQRMGALIDDLLTFSRLSRTPLNKRKVDMEQLVTHVIEELELLREGRQIEIVNGHLPACAGDPSLLNQVWMNLLGNAFKYTRVREKAVVEIGSKVENDEQIFYVRDNGAGFDMRYVHKLFGVFQRLHHANEFEGTGVGLAIVQRVIHRHGGRVWAEGELNRGATFYFTVKKEIPS